jgi:hypothetical protein
MHDRLNDKFKVGTEALIDRHWRRVEMHDNTYLSIEDVMALLDALESIVEGKQQHWLGVDVVVEAIRRDGYIERELVNPDPDTARTMICRYNEDLVKNGWRLKGRTGVYDLVKV